MSPSSCSPELLASSREICERHARVSAALEKRLSSEHELTTSEFDVLEFLASEPEENHRMQDIADAVHLSQSALSRLIGRLENAQLVERCMCAEDRRGIRANLTPAGHERFEQALQTHREVLGSLLSPVA